MESRRERCTELYRVQKATGFIVAHLLNADPCDPGQVKRAQRGVKCHVKPSRMYEDFPYLPTSLYHTKSAH